MSKMSQIDTEKYQQFAKEKLGFEFNDISLLVTALTHRSYINEHKTAGLEHNERLEFLGDAVLELVTSDFLFRNYHEPEGVMTAWRAALVRTESIGAAGVELGYQPLVLLSKGAKLSSSARSTESILADCFEAVIGATYLDQGYDAAKKLIEEHILSKIDHVIKTGVWRDPKSRFQEIAQHQFNQTPTYRLITEDGPDHDKTFTVGAYIGSDLISTGTGHSKQEAQTKAASAAIEDLSKRQ